MGRSKVSVTYQGMCFSLPREVQYCTSKRQPPANFWGHGSQIVPTPRFWAKMIGSCFRLLVRGDDRFFLHQPSNVFFPWALQSRCIFFFSHDCCRYRCPILLIDLGEASIHTASSLDSNAAQPFPSRQIFKSDSKFHV